MRILFLAAGSPATVFALAPLASAARNAGHRVLVAATEDMTPVIAGLGLPGVAATRMTMREAVFADRAGTPLHLPEEPSARMRFGGRAFGRLAAGSLEGLRALGRDWRPDVVVGGMLSFGAALLAAERGIPWVRHAWDMGEPAEMEAGAADELRPELDVLGLDALPGPDLWIDICPPCVADPRMAADQAMRFVPFGRQGPLDRWMYTAGPDRRVCVTAGSRVSKDSEVDRLGDLITSVSRPGLDVVVAAPDGVAAALRERHPGVRAGWLPMDTVLETCDLLVHSGGGQTSLSALHAGVPQVIVPDMPKLIAPARRLSDHGAAVVLLDGEDVAASCAAVLDDPAYAGRARALAAEMAGMPGPCDVLPAVEKLVS